MKSICRLRGAKEVLIILKVQRDRPTATGILTVFYNGAKDWIET